LANDLVPLRKRPSAPMYLTPREAAFHPSAESYRERANILRRSLGPAVGAQERENLLGIAAEFEQIATALEQMRSKRRRYQGMAA
jgi:hypothetical protein